MKKLCLYLMGLVLVASARSAVTIYVSPFGKDHNFGTKESPMATLEAAWQKALPYVGSCAVTIYCREGRYSLSRSIEINSKSSGTKKFPVIFSGYPGEKVVITTSKEWEGLRWKPYKNGIMQATVDLGQNHDQLFINGKLQHMARYPNYNPAVTILNGYAEDALSKERVKGWENPAGGYVHAMHSREWGGYQYEITGKDDSGNLQLKGGFQNNRPMGMHKNYRMVENIFEELDAPGEWYYDAKQKILFFYPTEGLDLNTVRIEVPQLESIFLLKGTKEKPVSYVQIKNLMLTQTLRTFMKSSEPLLRSDWRIYRNGAILMENSSHCIVEDCDFYDLGGNAVFLSGYNREQVITKNHFHQIAASAVCCVGYPLAVRSPKFNYEESFDWEELDKVPGPKTDDYPMSCLIDNNLIHDIGRVEKQVSGVQISMSRQIVVRHNSIYNVPRAGINLSEGTWGGHRIEGNDVFNTVLETGDHGSWNSWGRDRFWRANRKKMDEFVARHPETIKWDAIETNVICNNRFRCEHGWDIDLDDGSSNYHIYNNVCLNGGLKLREGFYRTVENNIIINNSFHPHVWFQNCSDIFRHNIVTTPYYPIGIDSWGKEVDSNFFIDSLGLVKARQAGTDAHSMCGDPLFINPTKGDYRVAKGSSALKIGFKNFPMDRFGVQYPKLKMLAESPQIPVIKLLRSKVAQEQTYSWNGWTMKNVTTEGERSAAGLDAVRGVWILKTGENESNVQSGDVILRFNGKHIRSWDDLLPESTRCVKGQEIQLLILRNQKELPIIVICP